MFVLAAPVNGGDENSITSECNKCEWKIVNKKNNKTKRKKKKVQAEVKKNNKAERSWAKEKTQSTKGEKVLPETVSKYKFFVFVAAFYCCTCVCLEV